MERKRHPGRAGMQNPDVASAPSGLQSGDGRIHDAIGLGARVCGCRHHRSASCCGPRANLSLAPRHHHHPVCGRQCPDATARAIAQHLQEALGQSFVVENRAGAGGLLAANAVARAAPDGHMLLITTNTTHSAAPGLFKSVPYDPIKDFTPVARIGSFPSLIAVHPGQPIRSMQELVSYAKANPGKLEYGHGNSTGQIVGETLKKRTGVDIVRVAYRSNPPAVADLIAGHIAMMIPDFNTGLPQVRAGTIRPVAVFTKERSRRLPDIPTLSETVVPGFDILAWAGMFAPANTPPEVVDRLANTLQRVLSDPAIVGRFADI